MNNTQVRIVHCGNKYCDLRFPVLGGEDFEGRCPACGGSAEIVLSYPETREYARTVREGHQPIRFEAFLDNIRSAWNVGSMLRTADGLGMTCVHLGGISPTPEHPKVAKTSLGAERAVPWTRHANGLVGVRSLKQEGLQIWGLERTGNSHNLLDLHQKFSLPGVLVVGNEVGGIDPGILDQCDRIVHLPMFGLKGSYNVAVAFGMAAVLIFQSIVEMCRPAPDQS